MARDNSATEAQRRKFLGWMPISRMSDEADSEGDTDPDFIDEYDSVDDIAEAVIRDCAEAQDCSIDELEVVPITAIDEAEMPYALTNPDSLSQNEWDDLRRRISAAVGTLGPRVN